MHMDYLRVRRLVWLIIVFRNTLFLLFHVRLPQRSPFHAFSNFYRNQTLFCFLFLGLWYKRGHKCIQLHVSAVQAHCPVPLWVTGKPCSRKASCPIAWTSVPRKIALFLLHHNHQSYSDYLHFSVTNCLILFYLIFFLPSVLYSALVFQLTPFFSPAFASLANTPNGLSPTMIAVLFHFLPCKLLQSPK